MTKIKKFSLFSEFKSLYFLVYYQKLRSFTENMKGIPIPTILVAKIQSFPL